MHHRGIEHIATHYEIDHEIIDQCQHRLRSHQSVGLTPAYYPGLGFKSEHDRAIHNGIYGAILLSHKVPLFIGAFTRVLSAQIGFIPRNGEDKGFEVLYFTHATAADAGVESKRSEMLSHWTESSARS